MLNITKTTEGTKLIVALEGKIDSNTAPEFDAEVHESLEGMDSLVIDMEKLRYLSSAGLRALLTLQKQMLERDGMTLTNVNDAILEVFDFTGFDDVFSIE